MTCHERGTDNINPEEPGIQREAGPQAGDELGRRLSRAGLLKGAAALTAGVAGAGLYGAGVQSAVAAPARRSALSGSTPLPNQETPATATALTFVGTPGTTYTTFTGTDFTPINSTNAYAYNGFDSITGFNQFHVGLHLPQNALLTEASFFVTYNDSNGMQFFILSSSPSTGSGYTDFVSASPGAPSGSIQTVSMVVGTPISIDNSTRSYSLRMGFNTNGSTQILWGANVGWIHNPGLVTFASPHRIFGDGSVLAPGTTAAIDATAGGVPAGAHSAYCAVQAVPNAAGPMTLFPDGAGDPGIANWVATTVGTLNLFYMLVPLSAAGKFRIHNYFTGQIYVDAWGYSM